MPQIDVRELEVGRDLPALTLLDTSVVADAVLEVRQRADGFDLLERQVDSPVHKRYEFIEEVTASDRPWELGLVAHFDGELCGFAATAYQPWNRRQVLWHLYVSPARRRSGVASRLLEAVRREARRRGARQLWLETQNVNLPAIRAYQRLGFEMCGLDTTLYDHDHDHRQDHDGEVAIFLAAPAW